MIAAYPDREGPYTPHADDEADALETAIMHAESVMAAAEKVAICLDNRLADVRLAPRDSTPAGVADAEKIAAAASDAADAVARLRVAVFGRHA